MTMFEFVYCSLQFCTPLIRAKVRKILKDICNGAEDFQLLDVGGRKSSYTSNLSCSVHIIDLPRESEIQKKLELGLTEDIIKKVRRRRSNIVSIRLEDMIKTTLPDNIFDGAVSIEVIEHVPDDSAFVYQIHRVLKPGGVAVLTTPNGESVKNTNPDHIRHYTRLELEAKLKDCFEDVQIIYAVRQGYLYRMSLKFPSSKPQDIIVAPWIILCSLLTRLTEGDPSTKAIGTSHLIAVARKQA